MLKRHIDIKEARTAKIEQLTQNEYFLGT